MSPACAQQAALERRRRGASGVYQALLEDDHAQFAPVTTTRRPRSHSAGAALSAASWPLAK